MTLGTARALTAVAGAVGFADMRCATHSLLGAGRPVYRRESDSVRSRGFGRSSLRRRLCNAFPAVGRLKSEHFRLNGELLPHVFLGDVARYAISLFESTNDLAKRELDMLCGFMETESYIGSAICSCP